MTTDAETLAVYNAKAAEYDQVFCSGQPGAHLKRFMAALRPGGHVLDLGCGPGTSGATLQDHGFVVTCVDASEEMVARAQARGLNARVETFDELSGERLYDGVWANFSLLHAPRAKLPQYFAALSRAMVPGAAFHIGMKEGTGEKRDGLGRLYTFVTEGEVRQLMETVGIAVTSCNHFEEVGLAGTQDPCLIIQGRKDG